MKNGAELVAEQVKELETAGLTPEQQDIATKGQLAGAAACYALMAAYYFGNGRQIVVGIWPLKEELFETEAEDLVKLARAGALIQLELERVQRAATAEAKNGKAILLLPPNHKRQ
jgi:hypothetical protein